jgi:hypothetical protein
MVGQYAPYALRVAYLRRDPIFRRKNPAFIQTAT